MWILASLKALAVVLLCQGIAVLHVSPGFCAYHYESIALWSLEDRAPKGSPLRAAIPKYRELMYRELTPQVAYGFTVSFYDGAPGTKYKRIVMESPWVVSLEDPLLFEASHNPQLADVANHVRPELALAKLIATLREVGESHAAIIVDPEYRKEIEDLAEAIELKFNKQPPR